MAAVADQFLGVDGSSCYVMPKGAY
jgi:hypothetical protein